MNFTTLRMMLSGVILVLSALTGLSDANTVTTVGRLKCEPDIDGVIDSDPAWRNIPWNKGAFYILNTDKAADLQTRFKIGYTAKGLYLAVQCDEPQPGNMLAAKSDMESVWADDSLEVWLSAGKADKMQLVTNSTGARNNAGIDMLLNWPVATFIGEKSWNVEMFIPYETVKQIPDGSWQLGVCRNIQTLKNKPYYTAWRLLPPAKSYSDLLPLSFSGSLSGQELDLIRKQQQEALKNKYSLVVVLPGKGVELLKKGFNNDLLIMAQGCGLMPRISADGNTLYFNSTSGGAPGVWKLGIADRKTARICDGSQAACSADGKLIVFQRAGRIISRSLDNGAEKIISPEAWTNCAFPEFLPDGRVIFIVSGNPDKMYLASGDTMPELLLSGEIGCARCSPDGRLIAYQNGPHLRLYDIAARSSRPLTSINGIQRCPSWTRDSKNVVFCQLFDQFNSVGDVYVQDIAGKNIERIAQNVDAFPDFNGGGWEFSKKAVALPVPQVIKVSSADKPAASGTDIPADAKEIVLDSGSATLSVSSANNQIQWTLKGGSGKIGPMQIAPLDLKGLPFSGINSVKLEKDGNNRIVCRVELSGAEHGSVIIVMEAGLPVLKISSNDAVGSVDLRHELKMVAGCDRYAWDMLYLPRDIVKYPAVAAYSPLMVLFPDNENCLFMVMAPDRDVRLLQGKETADFGGVSVAAGKTGGDLFLFGLTGAKLWGNIVIGEVNAAANSAGATPAAQCGTSMCPPLPVLSASLLSGKTMTLKCAIPAALQWRYIVADKQGNDYSGMFTSNAAAGSFEFKIPELPAVQGGAPAFYYPYDRLKLTPVQDFTPMDLIINAVGLKRTAELFDIRGIREVRVAKPECMYKDYRIILNWYKYTFITQPCAADTACRLADDLSAIFSGVLNRNAEYQKFFAGLKTQTDKLPRTELAVRILDIVKASEKLNAAADCGKKFNDSLEKFKAAAKKLNARDATKEFADAASRLFQQEINNVRQYRLLVRQVRMLYGRLAAVFPENKVSYEKIRDDCRRLLLNPVYHENMNNDENIINPELADYEATK